MNKLLSIIIPTYNMERYLRKCLDSLLVETSLMDQLEVLVINDGSKDSSSAIAHEYEAKYPQTFSVVDKANGHYGSCINKGLELATGKYVKVLDADDSFDNKAFSIFLQKIANIDVDLILTEYFTVDEKGKEIGRSSMHSFGLEEGKPFDFHSFLKNNPNFGYAMHCCAYRLQMLKDMCYKQTEGVSYTDTEWSIIPVIRVNSCCYLSLIIYQYLLGRNGQSMDNKVMVSSVSDLMKVYQSIILFYEFNVVKKELYGVLFRNTINILLTLIYCVSLFEKRTDLEKIIQFDKELEQHPFAYELSKQIKGFRNFYCVQYWRKHNRKPLPIYFVWIRHLGMLKYKLKR